MATEWKTKTNLSKVGIGLRFRSRKKLGLGNLVVPESPFNAKQFDGYASVLAIYNFTATQYDGFANSITITDFAGVLYDGVDSVVTLGNFVGNQYDGYSTSTLTL
jgi:hypothetical protein